MDTMGVRAETSPDEVLGVNASGLVSGSRQLALHACIPDGHHHGLRGVGVSMT